MLLNIIQHEKKWTKQCTNGALGWGCSQRPHGSLKPTQTANTALIGNSVCPTLARLSYWPEKAMAKIPPVAVSRWNLSRTWLEELCAIFLDKLRVKTPSCREVCCGPSLHIGKKVLYVISCHQGLQERPRVGGCDARKLSSPSPWGLPTELVEPLFIWFFASATHWWALGLHKHHGAGLLVFFVRGGELW